MKKPLIAMPQWGNNLLRLYMKSKYMFSLRRAGARILWIEMDDPDIAEKTRTCDGLLLPGGDDIDPSRYGAARHEKCGKSSTLRDEAEWKMLEAFLPTGKPILGICRGCQFLNIYLGGTLHQHIEGHSDFKTRGKGCHAVSVEPGSTLSSLLPEKVWVNSLHHQAVDVLGSGLTVSAKAEDGTVEAIELKKHPFCVAVQWHPEHLSSSRADQQEIFNHFVSLCKKQKGGHLHDASKASQQQY